MTAKHVIVRFDVDYKIKIIDAFTDRDEELPVWGSRCLVDLTTDPKFFSPPGQYTVVYYLEPEKDTGLKVIEHDTFVMLYDTVRDRRVCACFIPREWIGQSVRRELEYLHLYDVE